MNRERRYFVAKLKDVHKYLSIEEQALLHGMGQKIEGARQAEGRKPLEAVCIESDWPIYEAAWNLVAKLSEWENRDLPTNKACRTCTQFNRCQRLFSISPLRNKCEFSPSRYEERKNADMP